MSIFPAPETVPPATAVPWSPYAGAQKRRSAGKAWLLSIIPGVGQLYCGAKVRGAAMLVCFVVAAGVTIFAESEFKWMAVRLLVMLYALAPLDAYETRRELNAGMDADAPHNPRVAAFLNLTTNGLGYVYIGHRLGFVVFILMMTFGRAIAGTIPLLAEIVVALLAIHVWKQAEAKREETYPRALRPATEETKLPRAVPVVASIFVLGVYYLLTIIGQIAMWRSR